MYQQDSVMPLWWQQPQSKSHRRLQNRSIASVGTMVHLETSLYTFHYLRSWVAVIQLGRGGFHFISLPFRSRKRQSQSELPWSVILRENNMKRALVLDRACSLLRSTPNRMSDFTSCHAKPFLFLLFIWIYAWNFHDFQNLFKLMSFNLKII